MGTFGGESAEVTVMTTETAPEYREILDRIAGWPPAARLALLRDVLDTLTPEVPTVVRQAPRSGRPTLEEVVGLLKTDELPPTDEQVKQWLEQRRIERYG
jgi:hypothetical protein